MSIDIEAIKRRVAELNGQRRNSNIQLWKPEVGKYNIRCVPWREGTTEPGIPFVVRRFYYLGDLPRVLAPEQFNKPDPISELRRKLFTTKDPDDREMAKKLMPKSSTYCAIVVRGDETKAVQVWSFNKFIESRLLDFFTNTDVNPDLVDYMDPLEGIDLIIEVKKSGKKFNDKDVLDFVIDLGRRQTKLSNDPEVAKRWLENTPNVDDMLTSYVKTYPEIEAMINSWLSGGPKPDVKEVGTSRGAAPEKDALDKIADDVKPEPAPKAPAAAKTTPTKRVKVDVDDNKPAPRASLDDAFNDLIADTHNE